MVNFVTPLKKVSPSNNLIILVDLVLHQKHQGTKNNPIACFLVRLLKHQSTQSSSNCSYATYASQETLLTGFNLLFSFVHTKRK